jgi:pimeloyl-ACP methyl ester carboxylesterase
MPLLRRLRQHASILGAAIIACAVPATTFAQLPGATDARGAFSLAPCEVGALTAKCGTYWVFENRARRAGRTIPLKVIILPSTSPTPEPDPMWFVSPGGPGSTNSASALGLTIRWWREKREVVIVDLRGTGGPRPLDCPFSGTADHPESYLLSLFPPAGVRACRDSLSKDADLTQYASYLIADDLDDVRAALGYPKVNLYGASWGTRAVLVWLRLHPASVRSAIIEGVAPPALKNPLPHARSSQDALTLLFAECAKQPACHAAYPDPRRDLDSVLARLHRAPARIALHSAAGREDTVTLAWTQFAEALRVMTYSIPNAIRVPLLLHRAAAGDLAPFAQSAIASNRNLRQQLRFGFLLSITCTEDVPRILPAEIGRETAGTYLGDSRVREQMAACAEWPHGPLPAGYGDPVKSDVPVFLLSGTLDPVSPPHFAREAVAYLPNGINVLAPGAHVPGGPCIVAMERAFLNAGSARAVDTSCVASMTLPPFVTEP